MDNRMSFITTTFETREEGSQKFIDGYFVVFNQPTELWRDFHEQVDPEAITDLSNVRALYNHNHDIVLGSTKNGTLMLVKDDKGLRGTIKVNENDTDAMNAYERIKRGDVQGCSFGFSIQSEEYKENDDGSTLATLKEINLFEVSPCVFPAYPQTSVEARKQDYEEQKSRAYKAKVKRLLSKLEESNG